MNVKVDLKCCGIEENMILQYQDKVEEAIDELWSDKNPHTQWVKLPMRVNKEELDEMFMTAIAAQDSCGLFVVIGNGGSYLGIKAVIEAIGNKSSAAPEVEFIGDGISSNEFARIIERMRHYEVNVCVISKSGETLETIASYQIVKDYMFSRYGEEVAPKRIMIMTGDKESTLGKMAVSDKCGVFDISKDYSGNYSILSPASLFPMAVAGVEIDRLLSGAEVMATDPSWDMNAGNYAVARKLLADSGKLVEIFQYSQPEFDSLTTWISHLFMESDAKKGKGLYTTTMNLSKEFKVKGEYMQGERQGFFYTELLAEEIDGDLNLPKEIMEMVKVNTFNQLNKTIANKIKESCEPCNRDAIKIEIPKMDAFNLGQIIYFMLMSASISAYMFGVDPFERTLVDKVKEKLHLD